MNQPILQLLHTLREQHGSAEDLDPDTILHHANAMWRPKRLFLVSRDDHVVDYDEVVSAVVCAENEYKARNIVRQRAMLEGAAPPLRHV